MQSAERSRAILNAADGGPKPASNADGEDAT